jgi:hypothetical protein
MTNTELQNWILFHANDDGAIYNNLLTELTGISVHEDHQDEHEDYRDPVWSAAHLIVERELAEAWESNPNPVKIAWDNEWCCFSVRQKRISETDFSIYKGISFEYKPYFITVTYDGHGKHVIWERDNEIHHILLWEGEEAEVDGLYLISRVEGYVDTIRRERETFFEIHCQSGYADVRETVPLVLTCHVPKKHTHGIYGTIWDARISAEKIFWDWMMKNTKEYNKMQKKLNTMRPKGKWQEILTDKRGSRSRMDAW